MPFEPSPGDTHQVFNQPAALDNYNLFETDTMLKHWVSAFAGEWGRGQLSAFGKGIGGDLFEAGFLANKHIPDFQPFDRFGHRIDQVDYHPAYHDLMRHAIEQGHCSLPWNDTQQGSHAVRAALAYMHTHADPGSGCPLTMTFASVPAIAVQANVAARWLPKILSNQYDGRNIPWYEKSGVTIGMAMTEKQGGSDVRANSTVAEPVHQPGAGNLYSLLGHKWFCSAPMCDGFLVLAKVEGRLSCFLVPRWRDDGSKNPMHIQRLKNKLGNRSNASAEIEFRGAHGWLLGEEGRGINTIIQMVALTRYDCMLGSSALMAQAAKEAIWHTSQRSVFGKPLHEQPLMLNVLADLAIEAEAALAISMRIAHALDNMHDSRQAGLVRSATCVGKYWICKRAVQHTYEAMESVGGVGYVEENVLCRLYREAPVNAIWEGSGNVQCLDLFRVMHKEPEQMDAFMAEIAIAKGSHALFDQGLDKLQSLLSESQYSQLQARQIIEQMALLWQASTLLQFGEPLIADAFVASRLCIASFHQYGTLPVDIDTKSIVERALVRF